MKPITIISLSIFSLAVFIIDWSDITNWLSIKDQHFYVDKEKNIFTNSEEKYLQ